MGQQSFIIIALSSLLLSISIFGFMDMWSASYEITATQYVREQSLNIARHGISMAVNRLRNTRTWRDGYTNVAFQGGTVSVEITDIGFDTVRIEAQGSINSVSHNIIVDVTLSSILPEVESALTIFADSVFFTAIGHSWSIDGHDWNADGTPGSATAVSGIGLRTGNMVREFIRQRGGKGWKHHVLGAGDVPSVGQFQAANLENLPQLYKSKATITLAEGRDAGNAVYGSPTAPEIVYVPGNLELTGVVIGHGILVVDGRLVLKGQIQWDGLVISLAGGVRLETGISGAPTIRGALWVGGGESHAAVGVHVGGASSIRYSREALDTIFQNLGLRSVRVIRYFE